MGYGPKSDLMVFEMELEIEGILFFSSASFKQGRKVLRRHPLKTGMLNEYTKGLATELTVAKKTPTFCMGELKTYVVRLKQATT